jgi:hypothetical protein
LVGTLGQGYEAAKQFADLDLVDELQARDVLAQDLPTEGMDCPHQWIL